MACGYRELQRLMKMEISRVGDDLLRMSRIGEEEGLSRSEGTLERLVWERGGREPSQCARACLEIKI